MKMNGVQQRKWLALFLAGIPPELVQIWKYLARINFKAFTTGGKTWRASTSSLFQQQWGTDDTFIDWSQWRPWKNGKSVLAAIPTKPDQIWKYLTMINLMAFTTRKKTEMSYTHPLSQHKSGDWWMSSNGSHFRPFWELHMTSKNCFQFLNFLPETC